MCFYTILLLSTVTAAHLQQPSFLDDFTRRAADECLSVSYEFNTRVSGMNVIGEGKVEVQGNSYHMKGDGVEIYCDGASTWLIDEAACEVVIESADSKDAGYLANPVMLLMNLEKLASSYKVDGNRISLVLSNGTSLDIIIKDLQPVAERKPETFRPPADFGSDWIVTDLR